MCGVLSLATYRLKQVAPWRLAEPNLIPAHRPLWQGLANGSLVVRLPTQQEWEKAARGKAGWQFGYQSNTYESHRMNFGETGIGQSSAVGLFTQSPSPYGVMDMSGNVWEWMLTTFENNENTVAGEAARVLRGGSWDLNAQDIARAASRDDYHPDSRDDSTGVVPRLPPLQNDPFTLGPAPRYGANDTHLHVGLQIRHPLAGVEGS